MKTHSRRSLFIVGFGIVCLLLFLICRLIYLMIGKADYYAQKIEDMHERERSIKAERGIIYDRNGVVLASNRPVCTISVIYSQMTDREKVIQVLSDELGLSEETVRAKVEKVSSREKIKSNVEKEIGDRIREYGLDGVMIDEDYKRYYPYNELASKVLGFTGADNQGIIGLEVFYDEILKGTDGKILTLTNAKGIEIENEAENRLEPVAGTSLYISLDINIQKYAQQACEKVLEAKNAKRVSMIIMNPQNGEILAMVNVPEFDLNDPYTLNVETDGEVSAEEKSDLLNTMWRNFCISDTYEPGSAFKILTATAALEAGAVTVDSQFYCPGYKKVEDRIIHCHKRAGHGAETFLDGIKNSCNPVFMEIGERTGIQNLYQTFQKVGLFSKTGIDVPGEASSIMHKEENVGAVELATISFGQSFQITPMQLLTAVSTVINGGKKITPHFGIRTESADGEEIKVLSYEETENCVSEEVSETMKYLLEQVVATGTGNKAYLEGFRIGGKTATSEKLPRKSGKYIASFVGFAPADDPQVAAIVLIDEPEGVYYGGTIATPVVAEVYENILPYLGIKKQETEEETEKQAEE
jgi:stage V sporulation protein D (sporulation-specific penicillin-binding protein)